MHFGLFEASAWMMERMICARTAKNAFCLENDDAHQGMRSLERSLWLTHWPLERTTRIPIPSNARKCADTEL